MHSVTASDVFFRFGRRAFAPDSLAKLLRVAVTRISLFAISAFAGATSVWSLWVETWHLPLPAYLCLISTGLALSLSHSCLNLLWCLVLPVIYQPLCCCRGGQEEAEEKEEERKRRREKKKSSDCYGNGCCLPYLCCYTHMPQSPYYLLHTKGGGQKRRAEGVASMTAYEPYIGNNARCSPWAAAAATGGR